MNNNNNTDNESNQETCTNKRKRNDNHGGNNSNNNKNNLQSSNVKLSRALSWALRHQGPNIGLSLTPDGYVPVVQILACKHKKFTSSSANGWTLENIERVVKTSDKQRFQLDWKPAQNYPSVVLLPDAESMGGNTPAVMDKDKGLLLCIRATQGHSLKFINANLLLTPIPDHELATIPTIVHGTYQQPWKTAICHEGLSRMKRNHIHFATGLPQEGSDDVISGMRTSCDVYIYVNAQQCAQDAAIAFYKSNNGVLLTAGVNDSGILPVEYFSHVTDREGVILLDQRSKEEETAGKDDENTNDTATNNSKGSTNDVSANEVVDVRGGAT